MSVKISATATAIATPAVDRKTARKLREPITGNGPLVQRYNTPQHGLVIRKIEVKR